MLEKIQREWMTSMAFLYIQQRRYDKAIVLLEALNVLDPEDTYTLKALSLAYLNNGQYEQSLSCVNRVLSKLLAARKKQKEGKSAQNPDDDKKDNNEIARLFLIRSRALWNLGRPEESRDCMQEYLRNKKKLMTDNQPTEDADSA